MNSKKRTTLLTALGSLGVALVLSAATLSRQSVASGSEEANIMRATAGLLEYSQFSHHRLDAELANKFLDRYVDSLDSDHLLFRKLDLDEFDAYRPELARKIRREGDTGPAHVIYTRYLERLAERADYVTNLLQTAAFEFTGNDSWQVDRREAPRPADLQEAKSLWREQLRAEYLQEKLGGKKHDEIIKTLTRRYDRVLQTMGKLKRDDVLEIYLNALAHVYDPHSDYFGHEQMESFNIAMNLSLVGIGATLQSSDGYCTIRDLVPGGPAARSGLLKPGDRIVAVAQGEKEPVDIVDMPLTQAVELIRGEKGTEVRLTLIPSGADESTRKTISLVRDEIKLEEQRAKASIIDLPQDKAASLRLGVIDLPSFYGKTEEGSDASAANDVARLVTKLKNEGVQGILLDLRRNGGGSLEEAIRMTGLFIRRGPVVQTRGPNGDLEISKDPDPSVLYDGPLVVLTSRFSASASEILAGAIQDYGRGLIVGDSSTFGKGTVQTIVSLAPLFERGNLPMPEDPGAVKVTIRKFYRPGGASTQLRGVIPDIILPSETDLTSIGEGKMSDPLPWDTVPPADFTKLDRVQPVLTTLKRKSAERIENTPVFDAMRKSLAQANKNMDLKDLSLNEAERRDEKANAEKIETTLKRTAAADLKNSPPVYDITLQNVEKPGLPTATQPSSETASTKANESTNTVHATSLDEEDGDGSAAAVLREAENILADYIRAFQTTAA